MPGLFVVLYSNQFQKVWVIFASLCNMSGWINNICDGADILHSF